MAGLTYFLIYMAGQVISTIVIIILAVLGSAGVLEALVDWIILGNHTLIAIHIFLCGAIVICAGLATAAFFVTHRTIKHKLNLE